MRRIRKRKAAKRIIKVKKLKDLRRENPDVRIDETAFLGNTSVCFYFSLGKHVPWIFAEDSESEEEVEPLFIPKIGSPILWIRYTTADSIWMTVGEYDCGYVYEYDIYKSDPLHCIELKGAVEMEANSFLQV